MYQDAARHRKLALLGKVPWFLIVVFMHIIKGVLYRSQQEKKKRVSEWQALFGVQSYKNDKDD